MAIASCTTSQPRASYHQSAHCQHGVAGHTRPSITPHPANRPNPIARPSGRAVLGPAVLRWGLWDARVLRGAASAGWRGVSCTCWVGARAWDHAEVKIATSENVILVASPSGMVRAKGRPPHCPSAPFNEIPPRLPHAGVSSFGGLSTMAFGGLLSYRL